jgi:hypothetical protein
MKMIAGCASGGPLEPERLSNDHMRPVGRYESLEMAIQIGPAAGIEDAVRAESAGPPRRVQAGGRRPLSTMKDPTRNRDNDGFGRAHDVDSVMRMLPWGVAESLAGVQLGAIHGSTDDVSSQRGAGSNRRWLAGPIASCTDQRRRGGDEPTPE